MLNPQWSQELSEALGWVIFIASFAAAWGLVALIRDTDKGAWGGE